MCNVGTVRKCGLGICVVDANCRALKVWKDDGKFVGMSKLSDLLGVSYPWPVGLALGKDDAFMVLTHEGEKSKKNYAIAFRLKGLN